MSYKALYRKYRPQRFDEVAGQQAIVTTLKNALVTNHISHAYLFSGPRGTGKTTMARLFAKALNCEQGIGCECNECSNCKEIMEGSNPSVIEIDAASNNGVEEVRNLIEKVKYVSPNSRYKVYIIDEVHMMTTSAFNALLKTLEEPPEKVIFILATTEPHKVLPTILSRCQRFEFSKVEEKDMTNRIIEVLNSENIPFEDAAIKTIVDLADGGVRDALSMLDQVLVFSNDKIRLTDVLSVFGIASKQEKISLLEAVANSDVQNTLTKMNDFVDHGIDINNLVSNLLEILRDLLIFIHGGEEDQLISLNRKEASHLAKLISKKKCLEMIEVLLKAQNDFKFVSNVRSLFEIVLLKLCSIEDKATVIPQPKYVEEEISLDSAPTRFMEQEISKSVEIKSEEIIKPVEESISAKEEVTTHIENTEVLEEKQTEEFNEETPSNAIPSWILDQVAPNETKVEEKPKVEEPVISVPPVQNPDDQSEYSIDDETIIDCMTIGNKQKKLDLIDNWKKLKALESNPDLALLAITLGDGKPYIYTEKLLIIEYSLSIKAKKLNKIAQQERYRSILKQLFGIDCNVYGLVRTDSMRITNQFMEKYKSHSLKPESQIILKLPF